MTIALKGYSSKKDLKLEVGKRLQYKETSIHGNEYKTTGTFTVVQRKRYVGGKWIGREFFAVVTMKDDLIIKVV